MKTVVVSGALANKPGQGGEAWVRLNWLLGFRKLGFDVWFIEQISPGEGVGRGRGYFEKVTQEFGFGDRAALLYDDGSPLCGPSICDLCEVADSADLLVNIGGHLHVQPLFGRFRRKAYIDIDPGFTQFWQASGNRGSRLEGHDVFFTIAENIGHPGCPIPTCGIEWRPIRPPVVLDRWRAPEGPFDRFTTIANWRGAFGSVVFEGVTYGLKVHEFRKVMGLPNRTPHPMEIALGIHPGDGRDLQLLHENGWHLVDPQAVASEPATFQSYVQTSGAEFSVAQGIYVQTRSGWFSDRTAVYLASGRPVLVQDTGGTLPKGAGFLTFSTMEEAVAGIHRIAEDYPHQCAAARTMAERWFDSDTVLGGLLASAL